jgi:hypothetical protein
LHDDLHRLRAKLCREIAQSEHDANLHTSREARRLGDVPPAAALRAIAEHSESLRPRFESLMSRNQPVGLRLGRTVAKMFSGLRHAFFDRLMDAERSYRATLLGLRHGLDAARLLREVSMRTSDVYLARFCQDLINNANRLVQAEGRLLVRGAAVARLDVGASPRTFRDDEMSEQIHPTGEVARGVPLDAHSRTPSAEHVKPRSRFANYAGRHTLELASQTACPSQRARGWLLTRTLASSSSPIEDDAAQLDWTLALAGGRSTTTSTCNAGSAADSETVLLFARNRSMLGIRSNASTRSRRRHAR